MTSIIDDLGVERFLGNLVPSAGLSRDWPVYGDTPDSPMLSRAKWPALIATMGDPLDHPFLPYVHDQDGIGQCNCDAAAALMEFCRALAGLPFVQLSAADLYDRINGGSDRGSLLEDAMLELLHNGVGTADTCGTLWRRGMRNADAAERSRFKALEVFLCPTFDHLMSAGLMGFGVVSGGMWYQNYNPDSEGWLPAVGRGGGGHAVFGFKAAMRSRGSGVEFGIPHQNSWTKKWGINGKCIFPETFYGREIGGCYAIRSVTTESDDIPAPRK